MNNYVSGQRWISNTEPELGLGIVVSFDNTRVNVFFPASNERRIYAKDNAPLIRVMFASGDQIKDVDGKELTIRKVIETDGVLTYIGLDETQKEKQLQEIDLNHHIQFNKPQDRFFSGQIDPGHWFELRYQTWRNIEHLQKIPVRGLLGGRTSLIPHQLYIAHEAARRYQLRVMLADEVGLGKTIEAGMILHHRIITGRTHRVLIIVPESLIHQWLVEMLRRFNLHFSIFDSERCIESHQENPFLSEQLVLCSLEFFSSYTNHQLQALNASWDMVIVDEAHHLEWTEHNPSSEYRFVEQLAFQTPDLILLTATPEQQGKESHFARLRLLDPDRFYSLQQFLQEEQAFTPVAKAARQLIEARTPDKNLMDSLKILLKQDNVEPLIDAINLPDRADHARQELLSVLMDHHGTSRVLFRNTRHTVKGFPQRQRYAYPLSTTSESRSDDNQSPLFLWLTHFLSKHSEDKVLLICQLAQTVLELEQTLKHKVGIFAAVFHEGMSIIERDRAAAWFSDMESKAQLLICSEIGSEGRNFQFARHLILYDLPENPDLLQQRIGRLDRIGQKHVIQIHVPFLENSTEHVLFRWYDEGLNAFIRNCNAGQQVYELQKKRLQALISKPDPAEMDRFLQETRTLTQQIETELHNGRDLLLEINSCKNEIAFDLIDKIRRLEKKDMLWSFFEQLLECYGVEVDDHSPGCYILKPGQHLRISYFPELPEDGMTLTVDRETALIREDLAFLTWEHPMVMAAMDLILSSETGNAAISVIRHPDLKSGIFLLEILFIVECSALEELQTSRFLPPTPIRVLMDQEGHDLSTEFSHGSLQETGQPIDISLMSGFLLDQRKTIEKILENAENQAKQQMFKQIESSCKKMLDTLGSEIKRLARLKKVNASITEEEIEQLKEITRESFSSIQSAQLKLDAVRLIINT